jgi:adenylate cyclase
MSQRKKIQFQQWIFLAIAWQFIALWVSVYDHLLIHSNLVASIDENYSFLSIWFLQSSGTFIATILGGSFLVFYVNTKFADRSYAQAMLAVVLCIIVVMSITILIAAYFYVTIIRQISPRSADFGDAFRAFVFNPINLKDTMFWSSITAITQFVFQMNTKFGHGRLWKIITGKYRLPKAEDRIFMFVDLNSSTMIAEKLGAISYHGFLKDFFAHITNSIINNKGEIYQYVGDEIVIAWSYEKGIRKRRCLQCFFEMKKEIEKKRDYYLKHYGLVPSFKAGLHSGKVVVGEIGIFKRDITFSGDVLNTTARIRGMCKEFGVEVLASSELLHGLTSTGKFAIRKLGSAELRGKKERVELSTISTMPDRELHL